MTFFRHFFILGFSECGKRMCDRFDLVIDDFQLFLLFNLLPWDCVKCIYVFKRRICAENGRYQFEIRRLVDIMRAWNTDVKSFCHKISLQPLHLLLCCLLIVVSLCLVFFLGNSQSRCCCYCWRVYNYKFVYFIYT